MTITIKARQTLTDLVKIEMGKQQILALARMRRAPIHVDPVADGEWDGRSLDNCNLKGAHSLCG